MKYHAEVLDFLKTKNQAKFMAWLNRHPPLNQAAIMKELAALMGQANAGVGNAELREATKDLNEWADSYKKLSLEEEEAKRNLDKAIQERDRVFAEMDERVEGIKAYTRECIETNAPNANEMRTLTVHIINYEKGNGTYDPATWTWLTNP